MKVHPILACVLVFFLTSATIRADVAADWTAALEAAQQASGQSDSGCGRAAVIVRTAISAVVNGLPGKAKPARAAEAVPGGISLEAAIAHTAYTTLSMLYPDQTAALDSQLARSLAGFTDGAPAIAAGRTWGEHVARVTLADHDTAVFLNAFTFSTSTATSVNALPETTGPGRYHFTVLAGSPGNPGNADGTGNDARFNHPSSLAVDSAGNVLVADTDNFTIRKITPGGVVSTLAGQAGNRGSVDGTGSDARFKYPAGVAVDNSGNVFVADSDNHTIRKIAPGGVVTTLAGLAGNLGSADGTGRDARFYFPADVAVDKAGDLVVTEGFYPNARIRKITPTGNVSTLVIGKVLSAPFAINADHTGNLYLLDYDELFGNLLIKFTPDNEGQYVWSLIDPPPGQTTYYYGDEPIAVGLDAVDNLFFIHGGAIHKITPSGEVLLPAATGSVAFPSDIALDNMGNLYLADFRSHAILKGVFDPNGIAITKQPGNQLVSVGETAVFTVEAFGQPAPTYQWYRDSVTLNGATSPTLTLSNVQLSDAGGAYSAYATYIVLITSGTNSLTSSPAYLTVRIPEVTTPLTPPASAGSTSGGGGASSGWFIGALALLFAARGYLLFAAVKRNR